MAARKKASAKKSSRKKAARKKPARKKARRAKAPKAKKAKRSAKGSKGGPRPYKFDADALGALVLLTGAGNTIEDAATLLGVSKSTLERRLADESSNVAKTWAAGLATRRNNLRVVQYQTALAGNPTMQIWLGKQDLKQRDFKALEVTGAGGAPLVPSSGGEVLELFAVKLAELFRAKRDVDVALPV